MADESAFQTAVRRFKFHHGASSVETATATDGSNMYRAYFNNGGYRVITMEALYSAPPTPDEVGIPVETVLSKKLPFLLKGEHSHLYLTFNAEHGSNYGTVKEFIDAGMYDPDSWVSPEEMQKSIDGNSVWTIQWYPDTPVGFYLIRASSLDVLLAALDDFND